MAIKSGRLHGQRVLAGDAQERPVMGTTYAIPFHNSTPILYYNKTMFEQAGITQPPQTWAELLADAKS